MSDQTKPIDDTKPTDTPGRGYSWDSPAPPPVDPLAELRANLQVAEASFAELATQHGRVVLLLAPFATETGTQEDAPQVLQRLIKELEASRARDAELLAEENARLAAEHGIDLASVPPVPEALDTAHPPTEAEGADLGRPAELSDALTERRQNDPSTLTDEEREALARTETLGKVEERRASSDDDQA